MNAISAAGSHQVMTPMTSVRSRSRISEGSTMEEMHESQIEKMRELQQGGGAKLPASSLSINGSGGEINLLA